MSGTTRVLAAAGAGAAAVAGLAFFATRTREPLATDDDAPLWTSRKTAHGDLALVGKTVTVGKPGRDEIYALWRDFTNLASFMENLESVQDAGGGHWRWTIKAPAGATVTLVTEVTEDVPGEAIGWRSVEGSDLTSEGRVTFTPAAPGRGTLVSLEIAYSPPLGDVGRAVAAVLQREPKLQAQRDLRRLKMLLETGEIATAANRREENV